MQSITHKEDPDMMTEEDVVKMVGLSIDQDSNTQNTYMNTHAMPTISTFNQYPRRMFMEEKVDTANEAFNLVRKSIKNQTRTKSLFK